MKGLILALYFHLKVYDTLPQLTTIAWCVVHKFNRQIVHSVFSVFLFQINVLLQAYISQLKLEGFALMADMVYVTQVRWYICCLHFCAVSFLVLSTCFTYISQGHFSSCFVQGI